MLVASKLHLLRYFFVLTVLFTGAASYAQYSGNIQGFVVDPSGAAVTGATVILRNVDTAVENLSKTGDSATYRFSSLPPGNYVVLAEAGGFKKTQVSFTLSTGQTQGIDIHMSVASASTEIAVTSEAAALDVDENRIEGTLSAATVRDLPSAVSKEICNSGSIS